MLLSSVPRFPAAVQKERREKGQFGCVTLKNQYKLEYFLQIFQLGIQSGDVQNIGREGEAVHLLTLAELEKTQVDMFTTVFIGNKETQMLNGCLVTPRGYRDV